MAHTHGNEYRIKIIPENGIEELSGWMNSIEQVAQEMLKVHKPQGTSYWLQVRNILCLNCSDRAQMWEYPITPIPSPRFIPHNSRYLQVVESRNQYSRSRHS
jgi:hypothetical protein